MRLNKAQIEALSHELGEKDEKRHQKRVEELSVSKQIVTRAQKVLDVENAMQKLRKSLGKDEKYLKRGWNERATLKNYAWRMADDAAPARKRYRRDFEHKIHLASIDAKDYNELMERLEGLGL